MKSFREIDNIQNCTIQEVEKIHISLASHSTTQLSMRINHHVCAALLPANLNMKKHNI